MKVLVITWVLFLFTSCTIVPTRSDFETNQAINMPVPGGKSLIYIVRPSAYIMSARHFNVFMNNIQIGLLGSSQFYVAEVTPGYYLLTTQVTDHAIYDLIEGGSFFESLNNYLYSDNKGVLIDAQPGAKYYVALNVFLDAELEAGDVSIFTRGTFSRPSLVDVIQFKGKPLSNKSTQSQN